MPTAWGCRRVALLVAACVAAVLAHVGFTYGFWLSPQLAALALLVTLVHICVLGAGVVIMTRFGVMAVKRVCDKSTTLPSHTQGTPTRAKLTWKASWMIGLIVVAALATLSMVAFSRQPCIGTACPVTTIAEDPRQYFIAINLYNNAAILPHFARQLHEFISTIGRRQVFVSIYENGSKDNTAALIAELVTQVLARDGVAHKVVNGDLQRPNPIVMQGHRDMIYPNSTAHDRIHYLATVRNHALAPLLQGDTTPLERDRFTHVLFFNDIIWRVDDALRLLQWSPWQAKQEVVPFDVACALDLQGEGIYDRWVMRDDDGYPLRLHYPFSSKPSVADKVKREERVPMYSCWNGIAMMNAKPFIEHGVVFRRNRHEQGECYGSECFFICHDFRALGFTRIHMDTSVRVTYEWRYHYLYKYVMWTWLMQAFQGVLYDDAHDRILRHAHLFKQYDDGSTCIVFPNPGSGG